jgi:hypothetical protein
LLRNPLSVGCRRNAKVDLDIQAETTTLSLPANPQANLGPTLLAAPISPR